MIMQSVLSLTKGVSNRNRANFSWVWTLLRSNNLWLKTNVIQSVFIKLCFAWPNSIEFILVIVLKCSCKPLVHERFKNCDDFSKN